MQNLNWYVAGPWKDRENVRAIIEKVRAVGYQTCSRWAEPDNVDVDPDDPDRDAKLRFQAIRDVEDVIMSDGLIYVNSMKSEGKATELGISLAILKPIVVIGNREGNIFLNLNLPVYPTIEEALEWLKGDGTRYVKWMIAQRLSHLQPYTVPDNTVIDFPSE